MKILSKYIAGLTGLALFTGTALAQNHDTTQQPQQSQPSSQDTSGTQSSGNTSAEDQQPSSLGTVSRSQAEQTAKSQVPGGQVESGGLERQSNGRQAWVFDIGTPASQTTTEVTVDASNGNIVAINRENPTQAGLQWTTVPSYGSQQYGNQQHGNQQYSGQSYGNQQNWSQGRQSTYGQQRMQSGRFCDARRLIGEEVNDQEGEGLGHVKDLAFNTQGQVFVIVSLGSGRNALVPVQALNIAGGLNNPQVTVNATRQSVERGAMVQNNRWLQSLDDPNFLQRVYSQYNLQLQPSEEIGVLIVAPVPQGGGGDQGGSSSGQGNQNGSQQQGPGKGRQ